MERLVRSITMDGLIWGTFTLAPVVIQILEFIRLKLKIN
jgi:hypothetical protein